MTTAAAAAAVSAHISLSSRYASPVSSTSSTLSIPRRPGSSSTRIGSSLATARSASSSPLWKSRARAGVVAIRCEQSSGQKGTGGLDVWLGRVGMVGFAVAIAVEVSTGKGLLENFGLTSPLPTAALAVTGVVGVLTAVFIFQSASKS